jgi:hypothetical protein
MQNSIEFGTTMPRLLLELLGISSMLGWWWGGGGRRQMKGRQQFFGALGDSLKLVLFLAHKTSLI